ncbi:CYTH domain-containing protein [Aeromonas salmonicida subsp. salmonicida]|nr:CYTH domain-containing protein [Aeromonas salmonicida subsp. salmonicida]QHE49714.1 CYTH domain-containing protein [Aeromonas salmonicida subsp. salmonicida]QJF57743.1 CYTH domain-containing protein [Aeromonas salmonicida subsp. salmonicida]
MVVLRSLGFQLVPFKLHRFRKQRLVGPFHVTLDHLDGLGDFAELAIMTDDEDRLEEYRAELEHLAIKLGLKQREYRSYKELCELNQ